MIWSSESKRPGVIDAPTQDEDALLSWALAIYLSHAERMRLAELFRVYKSSMWVIQACRCVFLPSLAFLVVSFFPWPEGLAAWRWHLGLAMTSTLVCISLILPGLEAAIDGLQDLADQALTRAGHPTIILRK
jgi:hypothetical protein